MPLRCGTLLELALHQDGRPVRSTTRVEEVKAGVIWVGWPLLAGLPVALTPGDRVHCRWADPGGAYYCQTRVVDQCRQPLAMLALVAPPAEDITKVQRREFVRLACQLPARFAPVSAADARAGAGTAHPLHQGLVLDLSGGGAAIAGTAPPDAGALLDLFITLPDGEIYATAWVVRVFAEGEQGRAATPSFGVHFVGISEAERNAIMRYIFAQQRERRRKGQM